MAILQLPIINYLSFYAPVFIKIEDRIGRVKFLECATPPIAANSAIAIVVNAVVMDLVLQVDVAA